MVRGQRAVPAIGLGLAVAVLTGIGANVIARASEPIVVPITIHYSAFSPVRVTVPAGRPVTFVLRNTDPIDHEWIVGDAASHERHRTGTEPAHGVRPTEVSLAPGSEIRTTVTFASPASLQFICHLPGHERYGMVGTITVTPG